MTDIDTGTFLQSRLPYRAEKQISALQRARTGQGVHNLLFRAAMALLPYRPEAEIFSTLQTAVENCGRDVPDSEIEDAIHNAHPYIWGRVSDSASPRMLWPQINEDLRHELIAKSSVGVGALCELSPQRFNRPAAEEIVDVLFPGNPLICVGEKVSVFSTRPREEFRGTLTSRQFIVPSTMSKLRGLTHSGSLFARCLDNISIRRFAVVEFDIGTLDQHAALLWYLKTDCGLRSRRGSTGGPQGDSGAPVPVACVYQVPQGHSSETPQERSMAACGITMIFTSLRSHLYPQ